jgi:hypothetical protein
MPSLYLRPVSTASRASADKDVAKADLEIKQSDDFFGLVPMNGSSWNRSTSALPVLCCRCLYFLPRRMVDDFIGLYLCLKSANHLQLQFFAPRPLLNISAYARILVYMPVVKYCSCLEADV